MSTTTLAAVVAKLAGLGLPAKAAGVAVAVAAIGGVPAGAHAVTSDDAPAVVDPTSDPASAPTDEPTTPTPTPSDSPTDVPTEEPTDDPTDDPTDEPTGKDLPAASDFGQSVAADARDGGVDGQEISERARQKSASDTALEHRPETAGPKKDKGHAPVGKGSGTDD